MTLAIAHHPNKDRKMPFICLRPLQRPDREKYRDQALNRAAGSKIRELRPIFHSPKNLRLRFKPMVCHDLGKSHGPRVRLQS
jgi:hypothetical protein